MLISALAHNWLAGLAAMIFFFFWGAMWYSHAVFGGRWAAALGRPIDTGRMPMVLLWAALCNLVIAATLVMLTQAVASSGMSWLSAGLLTGALAGMGISFARTAQANLFGGNLTLALVDGGYEASGMTLMGLIIGLVGSPVSGG